MIFNLALIIFLNQSNVIDRFVDLKIVEPKDEHKTDERSFH
jgi:hypothetical protein